MRFGLAAVLALSASSLLAAATYGQNVGEQTAGFDGTWVLSFSDTEWTVSLAVTEGVITGVAETRLGDLPVEGTQEGGDLAFRVIMDDPDHFVDWVFSGTLAGDEAAGVVVVASEYPFDWAALRADPPYGR